MIRETLGTIIVIIFLGTLYTDYADRNYTCLFKLLRVAIMFMCVVALAFVMNHF